jgi:hypothetical protein
MTFQALAPAPPWLRYPQQQKITIPTEHMLEWNRAHPKTMTALGEQIHDGFTLAVIGDVERALFHVVVVIGGNAQRAINRRV